MPSLAEASLSAIERRVLERFVRRVAAAVDLRSVWLYGSRARGERPGPHSDVDLIVVTERGQQDDEVVAAAMNELEEREGLHWRFCPVVVGPEWAPGRRAIDAFFIREVDRDRIVVYGGEDERPRGSPRHGIDGDGVSPRSEEYRMRARRALKGAQALLKDDLPSDAVTRAYYAMFEAAKAALSEEDLHARTHDRTWHRFFQVFVASGRFDRQLYRAAQGARRGRSAVDYEAREIPADRAERHVEAAARFLTAVEAMLRRRVPRDGRQRSP